MAAAILGQFALPALAQEGNVLTRTVGSLPVNSGGNAANAVTGENTFATNKNTKADSATIVAGEPGSVVTLSVEDIEAAISSAPSEPDEERRSYDLEGDAITNAATMLLDDSGVIGRQRAVAESILMMDQQIKHQRKIEEALTALGPNTPIEISPGVFKTFEDTPAAIRAQISYIKLKQQLAETLNSGATVDTTGGVSVDVDPVVNLPVRDDGTGFQDPNTTVAALDPEETLDVETRLGTLLKEAEQRLGRREAEILENVEQSGAKVAAEAETEAKAKADAAPRIETVSVREIFGSHGVYTSIVDIEGQRMEIRIGDEVLDGYTVKRIALDHVEVIKDGQSTRLSF
ncbi:type IV pilus biogenesis protein PilP [Sulfitobacter litoralis]|uniref:type IV pilus biogenesis protein PilP n=1 Tax=Sulfitobacter litoralis TaxID=335975 RepID=UPI00235691C3|nr:type IV pilus biogenesis protein PilP [Sulfitobacter litoralis]